METTAPPDARTIAAWKHHLRDEADAAILYGAMAKVEPDEKRRAIYEQLAEVEHRHASLWQDIFKEHGITVETPTGPSLRTRITLLWMRVLGPSSFLNVLVREEGEEVKGYLDLHQRSESESARNMALTLARESAQHAERLRDISGARDGESWHQTAAAGDVMRNVIYGFNDGLTANFGLVAGMVGAGLDMRIIAVSGIAGIIADALSMGASGFLAAKSEQEVYDHEIELERGEIQLMPRAEEEELALIYQLKGFDENLAKQMAAQIMKDPETALREKVREELQIGERHVTPWSEGWVTGLATAIGALLPVLPFLICGRDNMILAISLSFAVSMLSHFAVGAARSLFTGRSILRSGFDMFAVGFGVAAVAYFIGEWMIHLFD